MRSLIIFASLFILGSLSFFACDRSATGAGPVKAEDPVFRLLKKEQTGLDFVNQLRQSSEFNVFNYMYFFNGGGLAAGDFNQDGLVDLYFTSNMGPNKLFLNEGNLKFKDVTDAAKVAGMEGWTSGATIVDINNDGMLDIYVSQMGEYKTINGRNQLFVCKEVVDGIPHFEDEAIPYGLDLAGFATQATFFDYDLDGDLDMYQLNHSLHANGTFGQKATFVGTQHPTSGDKLMRNDGDTFTEVTMAAGINSTVIGYGLGVATADVNLDGWPDIYIANDFHENDYLYLNQKDGTFKEVLTEQIQHTSRFSMGVDIADINNDAQPDIVTLDMLPEDPYILKTSLAEDSYEVFQFKLRYGYNQQFSRNNLQLNNGNGTFSEIGLYAGVEATDWSWAPLFFDFENDGYRDLFISNGIPRRMNDIDYINFRENSELRWKGNTDNLEEEDLVMVDSMPRIKVANKFYRNAHNLRFTDLGKQIDGALVTYSTAAIYADLDNDGDLDVVVNNQEDEPYVYQNLSVDKGAAGDFIHLEFAGTPQNRHGIGATVVAYKGQETLLVQHFPTRGYLAAVPLGVYLGVGEQAQVDSVLVIWPDQTYQRYTDLAFNTLQTVTWSANLPRFDFQRLHLPKTAPYQFTDQTAAVRLNFRHDENPYVDFDREALMPNMVSAEGPAVAVGDVNGDGLDDVFLGAAKRDTSHLFLQLPNGTFRDATPAVFAESALLEDVDARWADLDNDGDLDLVVANGGNEFRGNNPARLQRGYRNDGRGNLTLDLEMFPNSYLTASVTAVADYDGDGWQDVFFGARAEPWHYGQPPRSLLYHNNGNGTFTEVGAQAAPALAKVGMVTDGQWADIDQDGDLDLVLSLEWGNIELLLNDGGQFQAQPAAQQESWWNTLLVHDFDQDGDLDILAGSYGENSKLTPTPEEPLRLYTNDFDRNEQEEHILTYYLDGKEYAFATYAELTKQLTYLKKKYLHARDFARASLDDLFGKDQLAAAQVLRVTSLSHTYFENTGGLKFVAHRLPDRLQFSTVNTLAAVDLDGDGRQEVLVGGNFDECNIEMGRYDASYGQVLRLENGNWKDYPLGELSIVGKVKAIVPIQINGQPHFVIGRNDAAVEVIRQEK
ncbi:MAG: hypothetical protein DA408_15520 [Bacteroidetes bacterium]|nr:MAG: hypothetical protein DA408_15520 [Bacteroidota bacterium]